MYSRSLLNTRTYQRCVAVCRAYSIPAPSATGVDSGTDVKPFSAIPRPRGLPLIGTLYHQYRAGVFSGRMNDYFVSRAAEMGPIFREDLGPVKMVWLSDVNDFREFYKREAKYPKRMPFMPFEEHREISGRGLGLFMLNDEEWHAHRRPLNQHMLKPQTVAPYIKEFSQVTEEFLDKLSKKYPGEAPIPDIRSELFYWSLESAMTMLFEKRLGGLNEPLDPVIKQFVEATQELMHTSDRLLFIPVKLARKLGLSLWKRHYNAWETLFDIGEKFINPLIDEAKRKVAAGEEVSGITGSMVKSGNISDKEILSTVESLMAGAVDTTVNALTFMLLLLAKNPDKQHILRQEIQSVVPSTGEITMQQINQLHYLKATIKENFRLHPIAPMGARLLQEDMVIRGYHVPKGTNINLSFIANRYNEEVYKSPREFRPERWLRDSGEVPDPFSNLPFGHGVRSCIGRRIADLEMQIFLIHLLSRKRVEMTNPNGAIVEISRLVLSPEGDTEMTFTNL